MYIFLIKELSLILNTEEEVIYLRTSIFLW